MPIAPSELTSEFCAPKSPMDYKKFERHMPYCLECGDLIRYGRTDKRFCCDDCKSKYHNDQAKKGRLYRNKVNALIRKNYEILDLLVHEGIDSADLGEMLLRGFTPTVMTSCHRSGRHHVYGCYDIKYRMTEAKVYSVMKLKNL